MDESQRSITKRSYRLRRPLQVDEDQKVSANEKKNGGNAAKKR